MPQSSETSPPAIFDQWPDWWTSSLRASRANPTASPAPAPELLIRATSGPIPRDASARWDPITCCWKTCQASWLTDTEASLSVNLPKWGIASAGALYPLPRSARPTSANAGGVLPTPMAHDARNRETLADLPMLGGRRLATNGQTFGVDLSTYVAKWPTPAARDAKDGGTEPSQWNRHTPGLSIQAQPNWPTPRASDVRNLQRPDSLSGATEHWPTPRASDGAKAGSPTNDNLPAEVKRRQEVGGKLNPRWVEWLMGVPIGWLALEPLATESYRQWWRSFCG